MVKRGVLIAFPGTGYTCKEPLMTACMEKYRAQGYDIVALDYSAIPFREIDTLEEAVERAKELVVQQTQHILFDEYDDVVFLSKSLGTILAGWLAEQLTNPPRQFYLTPVAQALPYVKRNQTVIGMVIGTEDKVFDYQIVEGFCKARGIPCRVIDGVGHKLKYDSEEETARLNRELVKMC